MKIRFAIVGLLMLPVSLSAQQPVRAQRAGAQRPAAQRPAAQRPVPPAQAKRDALEVQVLNRLVNRAGTELALDDAQRGRLLEVVKGSALRRRALNQRAVQVQRRLVTAIRLQDTPQTTFTQILNEQVALRNEEQKIADDEQAELEKFMTPRQRAHFLMLWIRLQENARQVQGQMPPGGPPGGE